MDSIVILTAIVIVQVRFELEAQHFTAITAQTSRQHINLLIHTTTTVATKDMLLRDRKSEAQGGSAGYAPISCELRIG